MVPIGGFPPLSDTTLLLFPECLAAGKPGIDRVFPCRMSFIQTDILLTMLH
uniref:Uncharacterized protein n=1 Tax=Moniliophthora roreri TaxID=221103 RepID=A0A0W0G077_MONRR